ncbi:MAG: hypothetical protein FWH43_05930 [Endomicrobia bacterium]|nr:hypothetical protein [Endomicrobiia bacterium]
MQANLSYDKNKVTWKYNKMQYEYYVEDIFDASVEKKYIFIESCVKSITNRTFTYLALNGIFIVSVKYKYTDSFNVTVKILDENNQEILLTTTSAKDVRTNGINIFIIDDTYKKIEQYSIHGKKEREFFLPTNYTINRFFDLPQSDKEIKIICNGPADKHDKDMFCLSLNLETGEWTVLYSMLDK